tara:strand:+ start:236 stop:421 length:186 start_codon:yes stop_codon:yes gene_type:complete
MIYGWILVAVIMNPDGTLEGQGLDYFDEYEACYETVVELSTIGQGTGYTCIDDYVDVRHEI